jgi:hypothetical protein
MVEPERRLDLHVMLMSTAFTAAVAAAIRWTGAAAARNVRCNTAGRCPGWAGF